MKATRNGKLEAVKRLLAAGCSVSVRDRNSDTALHFAARHGNARLLSALIAASAADINMQVPVHRATLQLFVHYGRVSARSKTIMFVCCSFCFICRTFPDVFKRHFISKVFNTVYVCFQ